MKKCYIVGAMDCAIDFTRDNTDLVIACDGGLRNLEKAGVAPDLIIGDFDSLGHVPGGENVLIFPSVKDDTDTVLAVREGQKRRYDTFYIYGGVGGRLDHTLANIQTLTLIAERGGRGFLIGDGASMTVIHDSHFAFPAGRSGYVSVFAVGGDAHGVSIRGLKYEAEDVSLSPAYPIGVSNEFCGGAAEISVKNGFLALVWFDKGI